MLTIDLGRLAREQTLRIDAAVPSDDPLWEDTEFRFEGPVRVDLTASQAGSGEIVVRGTVEGVLLQECRRCLAEVRTEIEEELTLVFSPKDELGTAEEDPETRILEHRAREIELGPAVREELILDTDRYVVCRAECRGLCAVCGTDWNEEECDCTPKEPDPRWDALRAVRND